MPTENLGSVGLNGFEKDEKEEGLQDDVQYIHIYIYIYICMFLSAWIG